MARRRRARRMSNWQKQLMFLAVVVVTILMGLFVTANLDFRHPARMLFSSIGSLPSLEEDRLPGGERWVVVYSTSQAPSHLPELTALTSWRVVVVGDHDTQEGCSPPRCVYLGSRWSDKFPINTAQLLQSGGSARRTLGVLYAILHGAKVIVETKADKKVTRSLSEFLLNATYTGLVYAGGKLFNPFVHFGQGTMWPRGFPLSAVNLRQPSKYLLFTCPVPLIQHSLVTGAVEVDDTFRMTRIREGDILDVTFDPHAPPVAIAPDTFAPYTSSSTLYHQGALWAAVVPVSGTPRWRDVTRSYWAQRLLWEVGESTGFVRPGAFRKFPSPASWTEEVEAEFFPLLPRLLKQLRGWQCPASLPFFRCVLDLSKEMVTVGAWTHDDVTLVEAWLKDLTSAGYVPPTRVQDPGNFSQQALEGIFDGSPLHGDVPFDPATRMSRVIFHPKEMAFPLLGLDSGSLLADARYLRHLRSMQNLCQGSSYHVHEEQAWERAAKPRTLLVVEFNHPHYEAIPHLERNNQRHFPTRLYCGDNITKFLDSQKRFQTSLTFVEASLHNGFYGYECMVHAINMGYSDVEAYLYLSEDVLLRPWKLPASLHNLTWYPDIGVDNITQSGWIWWGGPMGRVPWNKTLTELQDLAQTDDRVRRLWEKVQRNLKPIIPLNYTVQGFRGCADIYQVGAADAWDFALIASIARKHKLFLEIASAFATIGLYGQDPSRKVSGLWGAPAVQARFDPNRVWRHSVKWRMVLADRNASNFLCSQYFPLVVTP